MSTHETIGDRVRKVLQSRGMKQAKLAELLQIEPSSLSNALGRNNHTWDRWDAIAKILDVPLLWLLSGTTSQPWEPEALPVSSLPADRPYGQRVSIIGSVTAGAGWTANQNEASGFEFKPHWQAVLIEGTSAEPVALQGQVVLIDPFLSPRDGRIVVVQTKDGRAFCKRFCAVGEDIVVLSGLNAGRDSVALRKDEIATMHVVVGTVYTDSVAR
jgi:SOS-response transcriptional repressor LexA